MSERTDGAVTVTRARPERSLWQAMWRGFQCRCPACGEGKAFARFLKVAPTCSACGEDLSHHRADDAPPYFTIMVVGHIIVPLILFVEMTWRISNLAHLMIWLPLTVVLSLALLPPIKGAIVGLQWALYMHGFHPEGDLEDIGEAPWQPKVS